MSMDAAGSLVYHNSWETEMVQDPPFTIKLEPVEGCSLFCEFCAIRAIRTKPGNYKCMELSTAKRVAKELKKAGWDNIKIELAMRGEPTMHPDLAGLLRVLKEILPECHTLVTTNGTGLLKKPGPLKHLRKLFDSGLDRIAMDDYEHSKIITKIIDKVGDEITHARYPTDKTANPYHRRKPDGPRIIVLEDISKIDNKTTRTFCNQCGCAAPLNDKCAGKRCARPFRELTIWYDGTIPICCKDWRGILPVGHIDDGLGAVWQGKLFNSIRRYMYQGERVFPPCKGCDSFSFRVGFLPDKHGKQKMSSPTSKDMKRVQKALKNGPLTEVVLRPWEEEGYAEGIRKFLK